MVGVDNEVVGGASTAVPWTTVALLASLTMFGPVSMDVYMPSLPQLALDLGVSDQLAQLTMSACFVALGVGQLVNGPLSDRFGRRRPLLIGVGGYALMSLACAFSVNIWMLLAARALQGFCGSAGVVIALATARDMFAGPNLTRLLALLASISALAPVVAPVVGGQLALVMDWRGIFGVLAGFGVILFVAVLVGMPDRSSPDAKSAPGGFPLRQLLADPVLRGVLTVGAFSSIGVYSYLNMTSFALQGDLGVSPQLFSLIFAASAVAGMLGAQTTRLLVVRVTSGRLYTIACCAWAAATLTLMLIARSGAGVGGIALGLAMSQYCTGVIGSNGPALALAAHARHAGAAAALIGAVGTVVGPLVAPIMSSGGVNLAAMTRAMAIGGVGAAICGLVFVAPKVWPRRSGRRPSTTS